MTAGRCPECKAETVKDGLGLWVLRHAEGCPNEEPETDEDGFENDPDHPTGWNS